MCAPSYAYQLMERIAALRESIQEKDRFGAQEALRALDRTMTAAEGYGDVQPHHRATRTRLVHALEELEVEATLPPVTIPVKLPAPKVRVHR